VVDEVMTGFRLARGGAIERYGIDADLVCWGKVLGGGLPVGGYGGRAELMDQVSPVGRVYQAGTLSGNPLAMAAGAATLDAIDATPDLYPTLERRGARSRRACAAPRRRGRPVVVNQVGSMLTVFFTEDAVTTSTAPSPATPRASPAGSTTCSARGVWWPPSQFEAAFLSHALDDDTPSARTAAARRRGASGRRRRPCRRCARTAAVLRDLDRVGVAAHEAVGHRALVELASASAK
jgi:glutamate-1-semialdehyde 2,1-aminomutase